MISFWLSGSVGVGDEFFQTRMHNSFHSRELIVSVIFIFIHAPQTHVISFTLFYTWMHFLLIFIQISFPVETVFFKNMIFIFTYLSTHDIESVSRLKWLFMFKFEYILYSLALNWNFGAFRNPIQMARRWKNSLHKSYWAGPIKGCKTNINT